MTHVRALHRVMEHAIQRPNVITKGEQMEDHVHRSFRIITFHDIPLDVIYFNIPNLFYVMILQHVISILFFRVSVSAVCVCIIGLSQKTLKYKVICIFFEIKIIRLPFFQLLQIVERRLQKIALILKALEQKQVCNALYSILIQKSLSEP